MSSGDLLKKGGRLAFILQYDKGEILYECMGGFWKLPSKALEEEGSLNEKRISCCKEPFYASLDQDLLIEVSSQMESAMRLLYPIMIRGSSEK